MPCPHPERLVFANESPQSAAVPCAQSHGFSPGAVDPARTWPRILPAPREHGPVRLDPPSRRRTGMAWAEELSATLPVYMLSESQRGQLRRRRGLSWGFTCRVYLDDSRRQRVAGYIGGDERAFGNLPYEPELFDPIGAGFRRGGARIRAAPTHPARRGEPRTETEPGGDPRQPGRGAKRTGAPGRPLRAFAESERERR